MNGQPTTIPLVPSWTAAAHIYTAAIEGGTAKGKKAGREGILEMANHIDTLNQRMREAKALIANLQEQIDKAKP